MDAFQLCTRRKLTGRPCFCGAVILLGIWACLLAWVSIVHALLMRARVWGMSKTQTFLQAPQLFRQKALSLNLEYEVYDYDDHADLYLTELTACQNGYSLGRMYRCHYTLSLYRCDISNHMFASFACYIADVDVSRAVHRKCAHLKHTFQKGDALDIRSLSFVSVVAILFNAARKRIYTGLLFLKNVFAGYMQGFAVAVADKQRWCMYFFLISG